MNKNLMMAAVCAAAIAAAGCSGAEKAPGQPDAASHGVGLMPSASAQLSRADSPFPTTQDFKAWGFKQNAAGASETVIPGYMVSYDAAAAQWRYDGIGSQYLKYWDAAARYYDFWAVYPPSAASGCGPGGPDLGTLVGNIPVDPATDVLVAHSERHIADASAPYDIDAIDPAYIMPYLATWHETMPLRFHHLFPQVRVYIYNESADEITLTAAHLGIATEFYTKGQWADGVWTYDTGELGSQLFADDAIAGVALPPLMEKKDAVELTAAPIRQLPQTFITDDDGNAVFNAGVAYTIPDVDEHGAPINVEKNPENAIPTTGGWRMDAIYNYYLRIPASGGIILVDIQVEDYEFGEEYDREVTDW